MGENLRTKICNEENLAMRRFVHAQICGYEEM